MIRPTIAFCGPIAARSGPAAGGVESGTRGIILELERRGFDVIELPYPSPDRHKSAITKGVAYAVGLPMVFVQLLLNACRYDVLHCTILYRHFIYSELSYVVLARLLRKRVFLHVRPGDWWLHYQRRSAIYRYCFRTVARLSHCVAVESQSLLESMRSLGVDPVYVPSFVTASPAKRYDRSTVHHQLRLVYVGALNDAKGLPTILAARRLLAGRGLNASLTLAGDGDPEYVSAMRSLYAEPEVEWNGPVAHESVRALMRRAHFFLFPTTFIGEGHSNALNECMAEGVVPVVSDHGANRHVVADGGLVLPSSARPDAYAEAVENIWRSGEWAERSARCVEVISQFFYAPVVMSRIEGAYATMTGR
jgi:glycosyltransferase involved in cell wall biosynthesis